MNIEHLQSTYHVDVMVRNKYGKVLHICKMYTTPTILDNININDGHYVLNEYGIKCYYMINGIM